MRVRIFQPSQPVDKGCGSRKACWLIQHVAEAPPVREPLMGWMSANDTLSTLRRVLRFPTAEAALAFARAQGWACEKVDPCLKKVRPRSFMDNFRTVRPEDEERQAAEAIHSGRH